MTPFVRLSGKRMKGVIFLKKRILPFVLLFAMLLSTPAFAASPRIITIRPAISFNGTTANCRVTVSGIMAPIESRQSSSFGMETKLLRTGIPQERAPCYLATLQQ